MNFNADFQRGFFLCAGVLVAIYVVGLATGTFRKIL